MFLECAIKFQYLFDFPGSLEEMLDRKNIKEEDNRQKQAHKEGMAAQNAGLPIHFV